MQVGDVKLCGKTSDILYMYSQGTPYMYNTTQTDYRLFAQPCLLHFNYFQLHNMNTNEPETSINYCNPCVPMYLHNYDQYETYLE